MENDIVKKFFIILQNCQEIIILFQIIRDNRIRFNE